MRKKWKQPDNIRWVLLEYEYSFCPVCGAYIYMGFNTTAEAQSKWDKDHLYHYCPMCGTNMFLDEPPKQDGESNEEQEEIEYILEEMRKYPPLLKRKTQQSTVEVIQDQPPVHFSNEHRDIIRNWAFRIDAALERKGWKRNDSKGID